MSLDVAICGYLKKEPRCAAAAGSIKAAKITSFRPLSP